MARKQEIRCQILSLLDSARPDWVDETLLLRSLKISATQEDVRRELTYLQSRQLVDVRQKGDRQRALILAQGVDLLEGNVPELGGVIVLDDRLSRMERERRKELRWIVLRLSDRSRPIALSESLVQRALHDVTYVVSSRELRRELIYLEEKGLVVTDRKDSEQWKFSPTADGVDVCEYVSDCPPGVGRPQKY